MIHSILSSDTDVERPVLSGLANSWGGSGGGPQEPPTTPATDVNDSIETGHLNTINNSSSGGPVSKNYLREIISLHEFEGNSVLEKLGSCIRELEVVLVGRKYCPLAHEAVDLLTDQLCVTTWVLWVDALSSARSHQKQDILRFVKNYASGGASKGGSFLPAVFIRGQYIGNAEDLYTLYQSGRLERRLLCGLMQRTRTRNIDRLETCRLEPVFRAATPPKHTKLWFPQAVNAHVARVASLFVLLVCTLATCFYDRSIVRYLVISLFTNLSLRAIGGYALSPYGVISTLLTCKLPPKFCAGAPWQLGTFVGVGLAFLALVFNLLEFPGHQITVAVIMSIIAAGAVLPGIFNLPWGPILIEYGIRLRLIDRNVYRLYLNSRYEKIETWRYQFAGPKPSRPLKIFTNRDNPIALRYKKKSEEWRKDDFDPIRHIKPEYFAMPLSIGGLAVAFKFSSLLDVKNTNADQRSFLISDQWFQVFASLAAFLFVFMLFLYLTKTLLWPNKVKKEWDDPHRSPCFACITMSFMLFSFLCYNTEKSGSRSAGQLIGRSLFWIGSVSHALLTVTKWGEWMNRRLDFGHVDTSWMLIPMGLGVAAFVAGLVHPFSVANAKEVANLSIIRFYLSFAMLLWITFFTLTFLKVVTQYKSDTRIRHGLWHWLSLPCIVGVGHFTMCQNYPDQLESQVCADSFGLHFWMGIFILFSLVWASFTRISARVPDSFDMGYWFECFALDTLAIAASLFYYINLFPFCRVIEMASLTACSTANLIAFLHTLLALIRKRDICTPNVRMGPLSFMRLTHNAMRQSGATVKMYLDSINLSDKSKEGAETLGLFAAHFNRFRIVFEEHTRQKDEVLFKAFSDFFPRHPRRYRDEHKKDLVRMKEWCELASKVISSKESMTARQDALTILQAELAPFFTYYRQHTRGEDENLLPIANKYFSEQLCLQLGRDIWRMTPAEKWETIVPFCVVNLPRQAQRVAYLRSLCWSMPERAQQLGAIVYRNVDDVMWERLRVEIPEMIPRGARYWQRYD